MMQTSMINIHLSILNKTFPNFFIVQDKDNPILLYLHGGPGSSTSLYDYAFTRKWSDAYTVVTWDQRNCGKSCSSEQNDTALTYDLMMSDGVEMTKYLLDYLGKDKITLLGRLYYKMELYSPFCQAMRIFQIPLNLKTPNIHCNQK